MRESVNDRGGPPRTFLAMSSVHDSVITFLAVTQQVHILNP